MEDKQKKVFTKKIQLFFYQNEINEFDNLIKNLDQKELSTAFLDFLSSHLASIVNKKNYLEDIAYKIIKSCLEAIQEDRQSLKKEIVQDIINNEWVNKLDEEE